MAIRPWISYAGFALVLSASIGCETFTERGALVGGGLGAATGALIGSTTADAGSGALIGGALGTIAGAVTGSAMDRVEDRATARAVAAQQAAGPTMTSTDVIAMSQSGVADDTIISSVRASSSTFPLAAADVVHLHNAGVSDRVIQAMMEKRPLAPAPVVVHQRPVVYVEPYPVYYGWGWGCHHHCW